MLGTEYTECRKAPLLFRRSGNVSSSGSTASFYNGLVEDNQLDNLFQRTFGPNTLDIFQATLTW